MVKVKAIKAKIGVLIKVFDNDLRESEAFYFFNDKFDDLKSGKIKEAWLPESIKGFSGKKAGSEGEE